MTSHSRLVFSRRAVTCLFLLPFSFLIQNAPAQIQQAWVAHYNNGITNGTNQPVKMALDSIGNIYVLGFSQNTNTNLGYVAVKYAPNGNQLWASRYDSTHYPDAIPSGFALDASNNVVVTGNAITVKYDSNGNELWIASYSGSSVAIDPGANAIVTGVASNFSTVKLSPGGSNIWQTTYSDPVGPARSQVALVDSNSNTYVAGTYTYDCDNTVCYQSLFIVKYQQNGNQVWTASQGQGPVGSVQVEAATLDSSNNLYLAAFFSPLPNQLYINKYSAGGSLVWSAFNPDGHYGQNVVHGLAIDSMGDAFVTGQFAYLGPNNAYGNYAYGTYKANVNGAWTWTNFFPIGSSLPSAALSMALDSANNSYVTGYSADTNGTNDIVTIKYDPNGNQVWLQRYSSPSGGSAAGNAIAVDNNGNVYVTGYDTTAQGGTEIVTIKYSPVTLQRRSDGTVILQAQGSPGEAFDIEASTNLLDWLDLGTIQADTNGLLQFDDTNAPAFPARFYHTTPQ